MWAKGNSTLNLHPGGNLWETTASEDQVSAHESTFAGLSPSGGVACQFRWSADAVRRLDEEVEWALTSNPRGAAEVAGLLLGKIAPTIEILDCHPVFLMLERDRANVLTGLGKREFDRTMAAFRSNPKAELSVIGFYRSHIGDQSDLAEEDLSLLRTSFLDTRQVALLMCRTEGRSNVRLFSGDQGQALCNFRSSENESGLPRWLELWNKLSADSPSEPEDVVPQYALIRPARELQENPIAIERSSNGTPLFFLAAAAILGVLAAYPMFKGLAKHKQGTEAPGPAAVQVQPGNSYDSDLALQVKRNGDDLRLDWNRNAPVIAAAKGGMLTIQEANGRHKQVMLDGDLLRTGAILYRSAKGGVFFRLVIFGQNGGRLGEWVASLSSADVKNRK